MATRYAYSPLGFGSSTDPFALLHEEMDRLFGQTLSRLGMTPPARDGAMPAPAPRMDVTETDRDLCIELDVPGVAREDIELTLDGDLLAVRGQRKPKASGEADRRRAAHLLERPRGAFERTLRLPFAAEMEQCSASLQDGVLTIRLAKSDAQRHARRIEIRGAQEQPRPAQGAPAERTPLEHGQTELLDAEEPEAAGQADRPAASRAKAPQGEQRPH